MSSPIMPATGWYDACATDPGSKRIWPPRCRFVDFAKKGRQKHLFVDPRTRNPNAKLSEAGPPESICLRNPEWYRTAGREPGAVSKACVYPLCDRPRMVGNAMILSEARSGAKPAHRYAPLFAGAQNLACTDPSTVAQTATKLAASFFASAGDVDGSDAAQGGDD